MILTSNSIHRLIAFWILFKWNLILCKWKCVWLVLVSLLFGDSCMVFCREIVILSYLWLHSPRPAHPLQVPIPGCVRQISSTTDLPPDPPTVASRGVGPILPLEIDAQRAEPTFKSVVSPGGPKSLAFHCLSPGNPYLNYTCRDPYSKLRSHAEAQVVRDSFNPRPQNLIQTWKRGSSQGTSSQVLPGPSQSSSVKAKSSSTCQVPGCAPWDTVGWRVRKLSLTVCKRWGWEGGKANLWHWFFTSLVLPPRGTWQCLEMCSIIMTEGGTAAERWVEARMLLTALQCTGQPHHKELLGPNINSATVENPWYQKK